MTTLQPLAQPVRSRRPVQQYYTRDLSCRSEQRRSQPGAEPGVLLEERGLYFLGEKDPKYIDLVSMVDPFKDNPGEKLGSLVEVKYGKRRWLYLGLGLWRQLPAARLTTEVTNERRRFLGEVGQDAI